MPRRNAALSLAALVTLGLGTGCEKQSPWVTVTAGGVVVKARATKYCRDDGRCNESTDKPLIKVRSGDTLGIDVPRSVSEQGWRIATSADAEQQGGEYRHDHYYSFRIPEQVQSGQQQEFFVVRDPKHGEGVWRFTVQVK